MKKVIALFLALALCLPLYACGSSDFKLDDPQWQYDQFMQYITNGQYEEARDFYWANQQLRNYQDAADYYNFTNIMVTEYSQGRLGYAYQQLSELPHLPVVDKIMHEIEDKLSFLQGEWVQEVDGNSLFLAFRNGFGVMKFYTAEEAQNGFQYNNEDFICDIAERTLDDGTTTLVFSSNYTITHIKESNQIVLSPIQDSDFDTFKGIYQKIS